MMSTETEPMPIREPIRADENPLDSYDAEAASFYDQLELSGNARAGLDRYLVTTLARDRTVRRVLDMTCGTGAQAIALARAGFEVTASDLSPAMLAVAARKVANAGLCVALYEADMRTVSLGEFDAIVSMYNAIGHLSPAEFLATCANAFEHLGTGGFYVFDIFDRDAMHHLPSSEVLDFADEIEGTRYARFSRTRFDPESGLLRIEQRTHVQPDHERLRTVSQAFTLQTYRAAELNAMLEKSGFADVDVRRVSDLDPQGAQIGALTHFVVARR